MLTEAGYDTELTTVPGGHVLSPQGQAEFRSMVVETATATTG